MCGRVHEYVCSVCEFVRAWLLGCVCVGTFLRACVLVSGDVWQCTPLTSNASVTSCERLDGVHDGLM